MADPDRFAIIPIYSDSAGMNAIPQNAVAHGSWSTVTGRLRDSRQQRQMLTIINDAAHARETIKDIRQREYDVAAREDAVQKREDAQNARELQDALRKLDAATARFDEYEAKVNHDPEDDELPLPPGPNNDDGDLEAHPPVEKQEDAEGDLPPELERGAPPGLGTDPVFDPAELAHPKQGQQRLPAAMEDEHGDLEDLPIPPPVTDHDPLPVED